MAVKRISVDEMLQIQCDSIILDVRSPQEYNQAHIPNAISVPLFTDDERKIVGTTYKQQSRENAIKIGLDFFGPKMKEIVCIAEEIVKKNSTKKIIVHCWRGGMRSNAIAWLLDIYGFNIFVLEGGYKKFRNWVLHQLAIPYKLKILGGFTGSGKTEILHELQTLNENIIDLEKLAIHKGSAFGSLGLPQQCSAEHFENKLALQLNKILQSANKEKIIWVESESQRIGNINIIHTFYQQMVNAPYVFLDIPFDERLQFIVANYGSFDKRDLLNAIDRIKKRLGGLETKNAVEFLINNNISSCFNILLSYYDKYYLKSSSSYQKNKTIIQLPNTNAKANSAIILQQLNQSK